MSPKRQDDKMIKISVNNTTITHDIQLQPKQRLCVVINSKNFEVLI